MRCTSQHVLKLLQRFESRNVTFIEPDGSWPIVWHRAKGCRVWDGNGKSYLDLTAAFGVAAAGHANPSVVRAAQRQLTQLVHAMGDVHPHALKAELARELSRITFERWARIARDAATAPSTGTARNAPDTHGKLIFCNSGFEAVEAALKTALLYTGRAGVIAFQGAYHGLGYGTLNVTHREHFRHPFTSQLREITDFVEFPESTNAVEKVEKTIRNLLHRKKIGAILVEPIQARGGIRVPPNEFLPMLRAVSEATGALLILDEIYTGFGRTGAWFACEHSRVIPDLICLGKAMTGGFPLSACIGRAELMDVAWPSSSGEAIHTSTFLGHPVGCAMALAQIKEIHRLRLPERAAMLGRKLVTELLGIRKRSDLQWTVRGLGLLVGIEFRERNERPASTRVLCWMKELLARGYIVLPEGEAGNVLSFTPPLTITEKQLNRVVTVLENLLELS